MEFLILFAVLLIAYPVSLLPPLQEADSKVAQLVQLIFVAVIGLCAGMGFGRALCLVLGW